jgi:pimeloyl-ACP methyl ester carboxylesterase
LPRFIAFRRSTIGGACSKACRQDKPIAVMSGPSFRSFPTADECFAVATPDGASLPVYGLDGPACGQAILFGHANGLAAGSYAPWLARLAERVPVFAFDARGHGGATWPAGPLEEVFGDDRMADDLVQVTRAVAARAPGAALTYVGHSLGAAAALRLLSLGVTPPWRKVIAFEPPIFPPPGSESYAEATEKQSLIVAGAARRRAEWPSPEAYCERLQRVGMFQRFVDDMLMAHCRATLRPNPAGGFSLACPPEVESTIYRCHRTADTWSRLDRVTLPIEIIAGDPATPDNDWISGAMPELAARLPHARLTVVRGTGHMLIFEEPERCAALVLNEP